MAMEHPRPPRRPPKPSPATKPVHSARIFLRPRLQPGPFHLSFSHDKEPKRRIAPKALWRSQQKIRELTRRTRGISLEQMLKELTAYLRGWKSYFGFCQTSSLLKQLDQWIRHRLRSMI